MARITVRHRHDASFDIRVRGYALVSDEPATGGGDDEGPTPTELMVAGLAACAAEEAVRCLAATGSPVPETEVDADFTWDMQDQRIEAVHLKVRLPDGIAEETREAVTAAMLTCPARKMLTHPPTVDYQIQTSALAAVAATANGGWPEEPAPDADSEG